MRDWGDVLWPEIAARQRSYERGAALHRLRRGQRLTEKQVGAIVGLSAGRVNQLLHKVGVSAPLGVYATQGDSEASDWTPVFHDLPVTTFESSGTVSNECFAITGLTLNDSYQLLYKAPETDLYHIWVGHRPGFSLDDPPGNLLISGHTHGGQVQIPFFGPVVTFSIVPRQWGGGGLIELPGGKKLVISRGIGMERGFAPRIRFFCRPQLVFLDLYPAGAGKE